MMDKQIGKVESIFAAPPKIKGIKKQLAKKQLAEFYS